MRLIPCLMAFLMTEPLAAALHVEGRLFRDEAQRHVILRGVNTSGAAKVPPFRAIRGPEDFAPLGGWGFNTVRLLFTWEAFEPEPGVYDFAYLDYYRQMVSWAARYDLFVIADIHQDAYSRASIGGCGEGFPLWTLPPHAKRTTPDNGPRCAQWGLKALVDWHMHRAWHHFYENTYGARDHYLEMLDHLAGALANLENLAGFDLLNEPWGKEQGQLASLYADGAAVIRQRLPQAVIFLSAHALTSTGLIPTRLPKPELDHMVHATHYYDPALAVTKSWTKSALKLATRAWKQVQNKWDTPIFLGEFGTTPQIKDGVGYVDAIYDVIDRELYSSAHWVYTPTWDNVAKDGWNREDFSINNQHGKLRGTYRPRPFVAKTPGRLLAMAWDESQKILRARCALDRSQGAFEVIVPQRLAFTTVVSLTGMLRCEAVKASKLLCHSLERNPTGPVELEFHFALQ